LFSGFDGTGWRAEMNKQLKRIVVTSVPAMLGAVVAVQGARGDEVQSIVAQAIAAAAAQPPEKPAPPPDPMIFQVVDGIRL
jgi:hypothetical protein